jgi:hypothetical protein
MYRIGLANGLRGRRRLVDQGIRRTVGAKPARNERKKRYATTGQPLHVEPLSTTY